MLSRMIGTAAVITFGFVLPAFSQNTRSDVARIEARLDELHEAASAAEFDTYFALYVDDAVFMGTDATERWSLEEFKAYAKPVFDSGRGWTYRATSRNVFISEDGRTAWFDEMLDNENLGVTRGTGVLVLSSGEWKFAQYNLTIPVPNQLAREFVARIRSMTDKENE